MSNKVFFTPGPSQLYFSVPQHLKNALIEDIPSISHRSQLFSSIFQSCVDGLHELLALPEDYKIFFTSSATEVWERTIQNLVKSNSYHLVNGSFSSRFHQVANQYQINASEYNPGFGQSFNEFTIPGETELISITLNETSAGFQVTEDQVQEIRAQHDDALIALDVVSIVPAVSINFSLVDVAYFSVQKCFGLPAGLGVWIVGPRAIEKASLLESEGHKTGSYHSIKSLLSSAKKHQTPETPNVLGIYLLDKVVSDMLQKGKEMMHRDTAYKAALIYQAYEDADFLSPFVSEKKNRSKTVCVAEVTGGNKWLLEELKNKKMILGSGYGKFKEEHIRIANFPTHSKEQIELLVDILRSLNP